MNRNTKRLAIAVAAIVVLIAIGVTIGRTRSGAVTARTITASYSTFETRLPETGQVQRSRSETLAALVAGNVGGILVRPGQHVAAGELLATIVNPQLEANVETARAAYDAARSRALKTGATLPLQNSSAVVAARVALQQAEQDLTQGAQSGLGYGAPTAQEQRIAADADVARTQTDLREAQRIADANRDLYANKAVSRDTLDQSLAKLEEAKVAADQAAERRRILTQTLARTEEYLRNRVRAQRDALRQAEANLAATRPGDIAAAQADEEKAAADLQFAQAQLDRSRIRAPFAGTVQSIASQQNDALRQLQPGDAVTVGQALFVVATDAGFVVRAKVDEQDVASLAKGQLVHVAGDALAGKTLNGRVVTISPVAQKSDDPSNTARQVITTVALERSLPFLRDGMTVDVDIVTNSVPHAIVLPLDAVRRDERNAPYALVVKSGVARRADLVLGPANDIAVLVKKGVSAGDVIVSDKNAAVSSGVAVRPSPAPSGSIAPSA